MQQRIAAATKSAALLGVLLLGLISLSVVSSRPTGQIPDEDWDYVEVRPGAFMFWWLYGSINATISNRTEVPLVLWLQGGPGAASTGYGNFLEIGVEDINLNPRQYTWANSANLLFVDNPVGTGYSYVLNHTLYTRNEKEIAADLVTFWTAFIQKYPEFSTVPFFIFSESYGGKMAVSFAKALTDEIAAGNITTNFSGVAVGDSWIDPMSFVNAWGPYLYTTSEVNAAGFAAIMDAANLTAQAVNAQNWTEATNQWGNTEGVVEEVSFNVNFYNILARNPNTSFSVLSFEERVKRHLSMGLSESIDQQLADLMNGPIREKLGIIPVNVTWGGQANQVFSHLTVDFMQSVVPTVDHLLSHQVNVIPYSGNLDLICCTPGTLNWINQLTWSKLPQWNNSTRHALKVDHVVVGFRQKHDSLHFYNVLSAGHMVPYDNPPAALAMLQDVFTELNAW